MKGDQQQLMFDAEKYHANLPKDVRAYLNSRGISNDSIDEYQIGFGNLCCTTCITIPVRGENREIEYLKLRHYPENAPFEHDAMPFKYNNYPRGCSTTLFNGYDAIGKDEVLIAEGELDAIVANQNGLPTTVGLPGAMDFKEEWGNYLSDASIIYICLDNDDAGERGYKTILPIIAESCPQATIMRLQLPEAINDLTDFFCDGHYVEELMSTQQHVAGPPLLRDEDREEMTIHDLADILDLTIKFDYYNKCILFLALLSAYTESDQINIGVQGRSSSGKTYITKQIAAYFPKEDIVRYDDVTPTAIKYAGATDDPKTGKKCVDYERKILLFTETPDNNLRKRLRPLLSHDDKEIRSLSTNRNKHGRNAAEESVIRGFCSAIFCTTATRMNEQEANRCILISPEVSKEKIAAGMQLANQRAANPEAFDAMVEADPRRQSLMRRIRAIKAMHINSVIIPNPETVLKKFYELYPSIAPRGQRDIRYFNSLIKAVAMLNAYNRMGDDNNIVANNSDIEAAMELWQSISNPQKYSIPPIVYDDYINYILPAYGEILPQIEKKNHVDGVTYEEIFSYYCELNGERPNEEAFTKNTLKTLASANMIHEYKIKKEDMGGVRVDGRETIVKPLVELDKITKTQPEPIILEATK